MAARIQSDSAAASPYRDISENQAPKMNKNLHASNDPSDEILDYDFQEGSRCGDPSDLAMWMTGYDYNEEEPLFRVV